MRKGQLTIAVCVACTSLAVGWVVTSSAIAATWLASEVLAGESMSSGANPQVAVDSSGDTFAVWSRHSGPSREGIVEAAVRPPGSGAWEAPIRLSPEGQNSEWPDLTIDGVGDATVVWESIAGGYSVIEAAVRPSGSGIWGTSVRLTGAGVSGDQPQVAVDPQGDATAVWTREIGRGNDVIEAASKSRRSETWLAPAVLSGVGDLAGAAHVALDAAGNAVAVWQRWGACDEIEAAVRPADSSSWQAPVALSGGGGTECAYVPRVAVDPEGNVTATWQSDRAGHGVIEADLRPATSAVWQAPVALSSTVENATEPRLAVDARGDAIVVWEGSDGSGQTIDADVRLTASGAWSIPAVLSVGGKMGIGEFPEVAVDASGDAVAAWDRSNGSSNYVVEASVGSTAGGIWQLPVALSVASQNSYLPWVAVYPQGDAVAAWEVQSSSATVEAAGYDGAGPLLGELDIPATASVGQPVRFSVSPLDVWSAPGATTWSFGDGVSAVGMNVTHTYNAAGRYPVELKSTDALGNGNSDSATITVHPVAGGAAVPIPVPLELTSVYLTHRRFRVSRASTAISAGFTPRGTTFRFKLSAPANLQIAIRVIQHGLRRGHACVRSTTRLRQAHAKPCTFTRASGTIRRAHEHQGADEIAFSGRIGQAPLALGDYRATLNASNAGGRANAVNLDFSIR
jgi:hypothetical protein